MAELITNNFNLSAASTFLNRASDQPIVFGYAVHAHEGNLDAFSNQQARAAMMQWLTRASAEKHWLMETVFPLLLLLLLPLLLSVSVEADWQCASRIGMAILGA